MSDGATAHEERLQEVGAAEAQAARLHRAQLAGGAKIKAAVSLYNSMTSEARDAQAIAAEVKAICTEALPAAMRNLVAIATRTGAHTKAPTVAQIQAIKLVAGGAGQSLEVAPGSVGAIPLNEMGLGDLEGTLTGMLNSIQEMRSIASTAQRVDSTDDILPHQGSTPEGEQPPG